ncbi:MAG TPA: hypothetical protein VGQ59_15855 [Cyclobacteriaceae bacterium]|jgi:hypothetical protein|nr:hypothetical protein [Cyclobacteriaceae bacterium]
MNYTIHPDPKCVKAQEEFLAACDPNQRRFHELIFMYGNIAYRYHKGAKEFDPTVNDWLEWIEGLDEPMKRKFRNDGFSACKNVLSFTRYVNEKNDVGIDEYIKLHMPPEDWAEYKSMVDQKK